jgi:tetratricopeptide (TPR) repeat protein
MKWRRAHIGKWKSVAAGLILLAFILLFSGCEGNKAPKEIGRTEAEKKKAKLQKAIERKFEDAEAHFKLGQLYQADGLLTKAEDQYGITLNFDPAHKEAQAARVKVLTSSGDTTKAALLAEEYIERASVSAAGSLRLALAFQEQGVDDYALKCYQQALRMAPNSAKINRQIGYYYLSKGEKDIAREYLSRSFQLNSNQPEVAGELGRLGVAVKIPRKTVKNAKKLDEMVEKAEKRPKSK